MKLNVKERIAGKKGAIKRIRRDEGIPAVIYSKGEPGKTLEVRRAEYEAILRNLPQGHLPTSVMTLVWDDKTEHKVVVKGIQYHPTTYQVLHLDFEELHDDVQVNVKVPIECTGEADCVGIKQGGVLRQVIRHVKVRCLPAHIPTAFTLNVTPLGMKDSKRLSDIDFPETVRPLANLQEVAVVIVKR